MVAKLPIVPQQPNFEFMGRPLEKSVLSFAEKVFMIIWMNEIPSRPFVAPLVEGDAEILERRVIGI